MRPPSPRVAALAATALLAAGAVALTGPPAAAASVQHAAASSRQATPGPVSGLRIHDIQGTAHRSPKEGARAGEVPGVVTAVSRAGFWFQDPGRTPTRRPARASSSSPAPPARNRRWATRSP